MAPAFLSRILDRNKLENGMRTGQQLPDNVNENKDFQAIEVFKRLKKTVEKWKLVALSRIAQDFPAMLVVKSLNQKAGPERE